MTEDEIEALEAQIKPFVWAMVIVTYQAFLMSLNILGLILPKRTSGYLMPTAFRRRE